jgi:hypothetical protein
MQARRGRASTIRKQLYVMIEALKTKFVLSDYANRVASFQIFIRTAVIQFHIKFGFQIAQIRSKKTLLDVMITP